MFNSRYMAIESFVDGMQRVKNSQDDIEFQKNINLISDYMKKQQMSPKCWQQLDILSFYEIGESELETLKDRELAKKRVVDYIRQLMQGSDGVSIIETILKNFYMFLEALRERTPHKKAEISKEILCQINIKNEYDIQFLLYAYLKPLFKEIRQEVNQDTGNETIRADILIDKDVCIEVKCSNRNMTEKNLGEQIKADMVHYRQREIYFFIYDKNKIIKNMESFKKAYESMINEKNIHIIIHQPKYL